MIEKDAQRSVKNAWRAYKRSQAALKQARNDLIEELLAAKEGGATFSDLGAIMKVSRQRVGQYLKGVE